MPSPKINVNSADINSLLPDEMPVDMMGLFYFAYRDFVSDADEVLARHNFGRAHHRVLYFVNIRPGMPVADLLGVLKITKQSLARVLRQLIDEGYVEQHPGTTDRRQRLLFATPKGQDFFATLSISQTERINAALAQLPPHAQDILRDFFKAMVDPADHRILADLNLIKTGSNN